LKAEAMPSGFLLDYGDVVVHIFEEETRAYYELEKFWLDAPRISCNGEDKDSLGRKDKGAISSRGNLTSTSSF